MRRRCTALRALLVLVGLVAHARHSSAQGVSASSDASAVVVIDAGSADLFVESLVRSAVEAKLVGHGYRIVSGVAVGGDTPAKLLACSGDLSCAAATMSGIAAQYVVFLSLRGDEPGQAANFKIVARSYEVSTGKAVARVMRRCASCIEDEALAAFSEEVVVELLRESSASTRVEPVAPVATPPEVVTALPPMTPAAPPAIEEPLDGPDAAGIDAMEVATYASLGLGVVGLTAGTILVLADGPVIEDGLRTPTANDTLTIGFASLGAGVALVGLSAWLWSRSSDAQADSLVLNAGKDAASFVYAGEF